MTNALGFILFAHGSSVATANDAVRELAGRFAARRPDAHVEAAFLELAEPRLMDAVAALAARGVQEICVLPYFLTLGIHLQRDLPRLVAEAGARHTGVLLRIAAPLDGHPALLDILMERAAEAAPVAP